MIIETALVELAKAGGTELFISSSESLLKKVKTAKDIKQLFINTGEFFVDYENDADQLFDDMANVLSKENMTKLANELKDEPGYKLKDRLLNSLMGIMKEYEIPHGMALSYANAILFAIMGQLPVVAPDKYDRAYQAEWKAEQEECFKELAEKFERLRNELQIYQSRQLEILSADAIDLDIRRQTTDPKIGFDFFNVDDDTFKEALESKKNDEVIAIKARCKEEAIYCTINELWMQGENRPIFIVKNEEDWKSLLQIKDAGNIYIPWFYSDQIVTIPNNTNIFVFTERVPSFIKGEITLRPRTYSKKDNNCQAQLDSLVSKIFGYIQTSEQWHYISNFFVDLCEVSPNSVLNKLEEEQINPTGLMELFENQSSDFLFGKNDYIEILWGVEEFLVQREYASRAYSWLLYLDNLSFEYKSNSPKDIFGKLLCTWHNFSAFSKSNDKIEIAAKALAKDKNAWDHIFGALPTGHASIFGDLHAPKYRNHVEEDTITRKEMYDTNLGYIDLLLKATDFKPQRWNDLLSIYDEVDPDIRKKIKEKLLFEIAQMDDDERLIIKNNIRRVVYKHRYFASAEWAMGEDLIGEMLDILDSINFTQQEYDFEYLFRPSYDGIILDPVPYDVDDKRDINESKTKDLLVKKINEFKENNYSLELLSKLCAKEKSSYLGRVLSDYWDDDNFDKNVFASLYKCQSKHEMAIEYIEGLARRGVDVYTNVNELSECVELDDDFRIILFRIEALYTDKKPLVDNASVEIKRAFWKDFRWFSSNNMDWAVAECQQYGTVNSYLDLLYEFHENRNLTPEQLLEKMQRIDVMERGSINSMTDHYLKELLKPLQEQCIEDRDKCAKIAHIEIAFFYLLDWEDMKCFQKEIKHDPEMYAEMVSIIFRHDGDDPEERKTEEFRNYAQVIHRLFDMAKFCPCEENGTVSYDEIKVWVDKLIRILDSNHQKEMFGYVLGRLFAYAPKTADGHYPCEAVCQIIEEYGDESLLSEYRCELFNKREIFSPSAGRAEKDIAEGYKDNAEFLSIKYPKTADVFFKMSQSYVYDSDLERRRAENGYF